MSSLNFISGEHMKAYLAEQAERKKAKEMANQAKVEDPKPENLFHGTSGKGSIC